MEDGGEDDELPKVNRFTSDLSNWLTVAAIIFLIVYGILTLVYEVVLGLAHVQNLFIGFLICCLVDIISYWICRFAVRDSGGGEKCLLNLVFITQLITGLYYLIAPIIILCTFRLIPEISATPNELIKDDISTAEKGDPEYEEQLYHTFEEYVNPDPCAEGASKRNSDQTILKFGRGNVTTLYYELTNAFTFTVYLLICLTVAMWLCQINKNCNLVDDGSSYSKVFDVLPNSEDTKEKIIIICPEE